MTYLRPLRLGSLELPSNIWYTPLAGCSDWPFRMITTKWKPGLVFCEMVKMDALVRNNPGTRQFLDIHDSMHPIGAQICGSSPVFAAQAARMIEESGFDVIDLNCGCPVDKVVKDQCGSYLLKHPALIGEILSAMVQAVSIPVTVKVRIGWDAQSINIEEIVAIAEQAGVKAITVHGRTRQQGYSGTTSLESIRRAKTAARSILVLGNGDVVSFEAARRMFQETGCDGIAIGRATMSVPWICENFRREDLGFEPLTFSIEERRALLREHFEHIVTYKCEKKALIDLRRVGGWYFSHCKGAKAFRMAISHAESLEQVRQLITEFNF